MAGQLNLSCKGEVADSATDRLSTEQEEYWKGRSEKKAGKKDEKKGKESKKDNKKASKEEARPEYQIAPLVAEQFAPL